MASRYNIAATLRVNNKGFIAGFAAAERAVDSFNRTVLTANGAAMAAQGTMAAAASSMAASAGTMASGTDRSRDSMRRMGDSAVDTRGRLVTAMNGMTTATNVFTSSMADSSRGMQATAGSSDRAARGFQLIDRNASGANRSLFTTAANAAAAGGAAVAMSGDVQSAGRQTGRMASAVELANRDLDRFNRTARGFAMTGMVGAVATVVTAFQSLRIFGEYEQSLADLNKVIDATDAEMREFDLTFRELNNTIPVTYNELAETAAIAGQLGIEKEHIADFAETMVRMGSSTVLSSEDAAMAIARLTNIMGSSQGDADRYGAAIVDLGNNFAAQEDEIVTMAMRIAGMGEQLNMSEGDVLGLSTALTSLGIRAEMGGSAITRTMSNMNMEVQQGTETGQRFAEVMGLSIEETATLLEEDAYGALIKFVEGLEEVDASGGNVDETLQELGITELRQMDTLRRLVGASEELTRAQEIGNGAWEENIALIEESETRYDTFFGQLQIIANSISDVMSNVGNAFAQSGEGIMGTIQDVLLHLEDLTNGFFDAEGGITETGEAFVGAATRIGGILTVLGLVGGAFMLFGPYGATTVAVVAGLGAIGFAFKEIVDYLGPGSTVEEALKTFDRNLSDVTDGKATEYVNMKDDILDTVVELREGVADEASKTKDEVIDEVKDLGDQIQLALDEDYQESKAVIEGLMEDATEPQKAMLESHLTSLEAAYQTGTEAISNSTGELNKIFERAFSDNRKVSDREFDLIIENFDQLDEVFATSAAQNARELQVLSGEFQDFNENTTFDKVQENVKEYTTQSAEMMNELSKAYDENRETIENSTLSDNEKKEALSVLDAQLEENRLNVLENVKAYETEAQMIHENVDALAGLSGEQKRALGIIDELRDSTVNYGTVGQIIAEQDELRNSTTTDLNSAIETQRQVMDDAADKADNYAKSFENVGTELVTLPDILESVRTGTDGVGESLGENFAISFVDGVGYVDIGEPALMKVEEFVAGLKTGEVSTEQAAIAHMNAMRAQIGAESLTPEGIDKMMEFIDGFVGEGENLTGIMESLSGDMQRGMEVDLGHAGVVTMDRFAAGLASGEYGVSEVMMFYQNQLKEMSDVDLAHIGESNIETLQTGMEYGFITAEQIASNFAEEFPESVKVDLEGEGKHNMDTLVAGFESGEIDVATFFEGLDALQKELLQSDLTSHGKDNIDTYTDGMESSEPRVRSTAEMLAGAGKEELSSADASEEGQIFGESFGSGMEVTVPSSIAAALQHANNAEKQFNSTDGFLGGSGAGEDFSSGISSKTGLTISTSSMLSNIAETELGSTTDGGGGDNAGGTFAGGIMDWLFPSASAAEMTSSEVERTLGDTDDGGGGSNAGSSMALGITGQIANARSSASSAKSNVENVLGSTTDNGGGSSAGGIFSSGLLSMVGRSRSSADSNKSNVEDSLGSTTDADGGTLALQKYVSDISSYTTQAYNVANSNRLNVQEALGATTDGNGGHAAGSMFVSGVSGQAGPALSAGSSVSSSGRRGLSSNSNTYGLGQNFGSGFVRGISSYVGAAVSAAANLARSAINAVRRQQRSSSPSKVMAELGRDNVDGFVLGISEQTKEAVRASAKMAQSTMDSFDNTLSNDAFKVDMDSVNAQMQTLRRDMTANMHAKIQSSAVIDRSSQPVVNVTVNNEADVDMIRSYIHTEDAIDASLNVFDKGGY